MSSSRDRDIRLGTATLQPNGSYINQRGISTWYNHDGQRHNSTGPAVIWNNGNTYWFLNGERYTFNEWCSELNITDEQKLLLRLQYV
jgi:hypothetical protein